MIYRFALIAIGFLCVATSASAQIRATSSNDDDDITGQSRRSSPLGSMEREITKRMEIERAENVYAENIVRARENARLVFEVRTAFLRARRIGREDLKKLERIEKLAKRVRSQAGGSDDDTMIEEIPRDIEVALKFLADASEQLNVSVEKTSRLVVSVEVIKLASIVVDTSHYIRTLTGQK